METIDLKKEAKKEINKQYYQKNKEQHKQKVLNSYHEKKKYEFINIEVQHNEEFLEEVKRALTLCNENEKLKIKFISKKS